MDPAIAKAAVDVAHAQGKPVFAHPQNTAGVEAVIAAGVDVMAHTVRRGSRAITPEQLARFKSAGDCADADIVAVCEAAVLDPDDRRRASSQRLSTSSRQFSENGGAVLFGTDVGFIQLYDTTLEYELMHRALSERQVLAVADDESGELFQGREEGQGRKGI